MPPGVSVEVLLAYLLYLVSIALLQVVRLFLWRRFLGDPGVAVPAACAEAQQHGPTAD